MGKSVTVRVAAATVLASVSIYAQTALTWTKIGNTVIDKSLAGFASGPVDRVWYAADGAQLLIRTPSGATFATSDFETWQPAAAAPPAPVSRAGERTLPEAGAVTRTARANSPRIYLHREIRL